MHDYRSRWRNDQHFFHHITPILKPLHWQYIVERIQYKIISLTYKLFKPGLAKRSKKTMIFLVSLKNKNQNVQILGFLIFDFNDPEFVKIYSVVFHYSSSWIICWVYGVMSIHANFCAVFCSITLHTSSWVVKCCIVYCEMKTLETKTPKNSKLKKKIHGFYQPN